MGVGDGEDVRKITVMDNYKSASPFEQHLDPCLSSPAHPLSRPPSSGTASPPPPSINHQPKLTDLISLPFLLGRTSSQQPSERGR